MTIKSIKTGWTGISALAGNDQWFGDFEIIDTVSVTSNVSTITFSSIPQIYTHLQLRGVSFMDADGPSVLYRLNGDTGANYYRHALYGDGTTASASASTDGNKVLIEALVVGHSASYGFVNITDFLDYTNTNKYKVSRTLSGTDWNGSGEVNFISGQWRSTSAITSIELSINSATRKFSSGTKYALYGIRG